MVTKFTPSSRGQAATPALLEVLGPIERALLVDRLRHHHYRKGDVVFNDGDPGDCLHLVTNGRLEVSAVTYTGQTMTLRVVHAGEIFGEVALVHPDAQRTGRVVALEASDTMVLARRDFEELRVAHPSVDRFLVAALAERVVRTTELTMEMLLPPETRLWRRIAAMAEAYQGEPIRMSQDTLAHLAGTVRQTANRVLRAGSEAGLLELSRGTIRIVDLEGIRRLTYPGRR